MKRARESKSSTEQRGGVFKRSKPEEVDPDAPVLFNAVLFKNDPWALLDLRARAPFRCGTRKYATAMHLVQAMKWACSIDRWSPRFAMGQPDYIGDSGELAEAVGATHYADDRRDHKGKRITRPGLVSPAPLWLAQGYVDAVLYALRLKFASNCAAREALLRTGKRPLVFATGQEDGGVWGKSTDGRGDNLIGQELEALREEIAKEPEE